MLALSGFYIVLRTIKKLRTCSINNCYVYFCFSKIPCRTGSSRSVEEIAWTTAWPTWAGSYQRSTWRRVEAESKRRRSSRWRSAIWNIFKASGRVSSHSQVSSIQSQWILQVKLFSRLVAQNISYFCGSKIEQPVSICKHLRMKLTEMLKIRGLYLKCANRKFGLSRWRLAKLLTPCFRGEDRQFGHVLLLFDFCLDAKHSPVTPVHTHPEDSVDSVSHSTVASTAAEHYRLGFQECLSETLHFLVEIEGFFARDSICVQLINHLQQHCDKILATST